MTAKLPDPVLGGVIKAAASSGALVGGVLAGSALTSASASFFSAMTKSSSILQSAYHIQVLSMSANLASPGVSATYRRVARFLRWSVMSIKGNLPVLDSAFSKQQQVDATGGVSSALGVASELPSNDTANGAAPGSPPPGSGPQAAMIMAQTVKAEFPTPSAAIRHGQAPARALAAAVPAALEPQEPQAAAMSRPTVSPTTTVPTAATVGNKSLAVAGVERAPPPPAAMSSAAGSRDALISWLRSVSQSSPGSSGNGTLNSGNSTGSRDGTGGSRGQDMSALYVIGGGDADGNGAGAMTVDASGRVLVLNNGTDGPTASLAPPPPTSPPPPGGGGLLAVDGSAYKRAFLKDSQDLLYTLATAGLLIGVTGLGHTVMIIVYKKFMGPDLPPTLQFPRVEMGLAGPLLVGLAFYACLAIGVPGDKFNAGWIPALLVLWFLVLPYLTLLWWLTVCRWYLEEKGHMGLAVGIHQRAPTKLVLQMTAVPVLLAASALVQMLRR
ncbi:hypothetical protein PLESTB_000106600 [Pleodorina starrii]|uniref:Uncharacterized protein n=1 Tax=Pleodorina starrii TaxID=330485 RepID=A0A9W6BBJ0_9CHLO|nr:hypothetical protein PLESTB_000106600 [Pleodorina starrii]GLC71836.1 hypothetical protein PLESTF_001172300 [Pleodorina starrii]